MYKIVVAGEKGDVEVGGAIGLKSAVEFAGILAREYRQSVAVVTEGMRVLVRLVSPKGAGAVIAKADKPAKPRRGRPAGSKNRKSGLAAVDGWGRPVTGPKASTPTPANQGNAEGGYIETTLGSQGAD